MLTSAAFFLLVAGSGLQIAQASLPLNVSEVTGYSNLGSWKSSTLYRVETDAGYVNNPLLIHLVGSRYGKSNVICAPSHRTNLHVARLLVVVSMASSS